MKKLKVSDLDKYLNHYGLKKSLKLRKLEKIKVIQGHIATMSGKDEQEVANADSEIDTDSNSDESGDDVVINDTLISNDNSDSESTNSDNDMDVGNDININVEDIFTTTRSGRITTNWRASSFL